MDESKRFVFVKDPTDVYRAVEAVRYDEVKGEVEIVEISNNSRSSKSSGQSTVKKVSDTFPIASLEELNNPPADLIKLMTVNLPSILNALKYRFSRDCMYTSVGPILVALNPFKWIAGVYEESLMMKYYEESIDMSSDPHVNHFNTIHTFTSSLFTLFLFRTGVWNICRSFSRIEI